MKLPLLLTRFLYQYKRLKLPGIGSFVLDPMAVLPDEHNKEIHTKATGIEFKNELISEPDDDLIDFIKLHTGKMKSLALADLYSYLTLGKEMVNIGKPFYLEGIGTLTKNKEGQYEFVAGEYAPVQLDEEGSQRNEKRRSPAKQGEYEHVAQPNEMRKGLLVVAIVLGLAVIGAGGYMLYRKNQTGDQSGNAVSLPKDSSLERVDTTVSARQPIAESPSPKPDPQQKSHPRGDSVLYKFIILETHNKFRALKRYNQLLGYQLKINLYSKDSSFFKVYFAFPAKPKDTVHIKDSLSTVYAHPIRIER